jgi:hypothetical protein
VLLVAGALAFKMRSPSTAADPAQQSASTQAPTQAPTVPNPSTNPAGTQAAGQAGSQSPPATPGTGTAAGAAGGQPSTPAAPVTAIAWDDTLSGLIDDSRNATRGGAVLGKVNRLAPSLNTSHQLLLVATLRANVWATRGDTTKACAALRTMINRLDPDDQENAKNKLIPLSCPPQS